MDNLSIEKFAAWMENRGKSPATVCTYGSVVEPLLQGGDPLVAARIRYEALREGTKQGAVVPATANVAVAALRAMMEFLGAPEEFPAFHVEQRRRIPLTEDERDRLLDVTTESGSPPLIQARDAALIGVLTSSDTRVATVAALRRMDAEAFPLSHHARHWIRVYLARRRDRSPSLFVRHDRAAGGEPHPLTPRSVERIVARHARAAGITGAVTPERIRITALG
jgi:site-specific recombinase XerD